MLNLNSTFPAHPDPKLPGLPVLVDLNWYGRILTSQDAGILHFSSRSATSTPASSDDDAIII